MAPHKPHPTCTDCAAHARIEQRIDWLYNRLLPWLGILTLVQCLALAAFGAWITGVIKDRTPPPRAVSMQYAPSASVAGK